MKAEVVVRGVVDHLDLWPYATGAEPEEPEGLTSLVTLTVHDSQELVGVLRMMAMRGLDVTQAKLLSHPSA